MEMSTKEKIEIMQAFEDGNEIECYGVNNEWNVIYDPNWGWDSCNYRIKQTPKHEPITPDKYMGWIIKRNGDYQTLTTFDTFCWKFYSGIIKSGRKTPRELAELIDSKTIELIKPKWFKS